MPRFALLLLLLVAVVCSCGVSAETAPESRHLRLQAQQVDESVAATSEASGSSSSSHTSGSTSGWLDAGASINTEASVAESTETESEGPSTMSFVGPAIAGVLAIVLIGAVVTFKNRMGK
jgi:cobalamin biosynthesis Mg chelatase CobN